ncbi:putative acyltransferase [Thermobacillus composti KWC4]|uniref:Putative acyltransferase n=1 Tax=Thermobacillus composti (strain DSM 18247 / JCM 13945 / KWC4) TaxID=717605 RepID=L0ECA4_THECK|nr:GNAT family N-acetyltransferase [Thermobacillus composti]AGA57264.1 putative acyltransferase [Thermobacillus composti KWC4]
MLVSLRARDEALERPAFLRDEARFHLIGQLSGIPDALRIKSSDGMLLYAQTPGRNGWLWVDPFAAEDARRSRICELAERLDDVDLPGVIGDPAAARAFADAYAARRRMAWTERLMLVPYECRELRCAPAAEGGIRRAGSADRYTAARFLAGFSRDAYGEHVAAFTQLPAADRMIEGGELFFWTAGGECVAMANIAYRSARHGRINAVYTRPDARRRGYGSTITAELTLRLLDEGLTPLLYADAANPGSNRMYRRIGYEPLRPIVEIGFHREWSA